MYTDCVEASFIGEQDMTATQLIELMSRTPFQPFEIRLSDGSRMRVKDPFRISTARNSSTCTVYEDDLARIVSLRNITEVVTPDTIAG